MNMEFNEKLDKIQKLENDWDGHGSPPFSKTTIETTRKFLNLLCQGFTVYSVAPTSDDSILVKLTTNNDKLIMLEIEENDIGIAVEINEKGEKYTYFDVQLK